MAQIQLTDVVKDYKIRKRNDGRSKLADFLRPGYDSKRAVDNISFTIEPGEMVGYIGPNGAGKSTTIKMLTGILTPTSGEVRVFGRDPCKNRKKNAMKIGLVFGQRSQLLWDLPVRDTFELFRTMYRMEHEFFVRQRDRLIEMLDMSDFLSQAVRQLSLGQRMRANLALCFLHQPEVVYLDEPTIGLDVLVKDRIRSFLKQINQEQGTTILLTTHDTQDIEQVTQRLMLIDNGRLLFDGSQDNFREKYKGFVKETEVKVRESGLEDILKSIYAE
jgi:ABC-2 type transport system ATP-binding protein